MKTQTEQIQVGGKHAVTAAVTNVLAGQGVTAPHTNAPFTEAMLMGIGGGLGAGYILWEFKREQSAIIVLDFRNRWNYPVEYLTNLCNRIGAQVTVQETSGKKAADANLQAALEKGVPFIAWVDKAHFPHQNLPESLKGYVSHIVGIHGRDDAGVLVDDLADGLFTVPFEDFAAGRGRIVSDKNRLALVDPPAEIDLKAAVLAGITDCVEHLGRDSESFALPVYKKWAKLMTDTRNKKGWPVVFKARNGLYDTLRSIFEGITLDGTDGSGLRAMYANFLDEAADVTGKSALKEAAEQYRSVAELWSNLAESAMPDDVPAFKETKALMRQRYRLYQAQQLEEMRSVSDRLQALQAEFNTEFPLDDAGVEALFANLQAQLNEIYEAETSALSKLATAVK